MDRGITLSSRPWMISVSCVQSANVGLPARHGVDPALSRRGEHGGKILETGPDAGAVAQLREFVVHQFAAEGENVEQLAHVVERGLVAPDGVKTRRDPEGHADAAHQHQTLDPLGMADRQRQGDGAAEGIADDMRLGRFRARRAGRPPAPPRCPCRISRPRDARRSRSRPCPERSRDGSWRVRAAPAANWPRRLRRGPSRECTAPESRSRDHGNWCRSRRRRRSDEAISGSATFMRSLQASLLRPQSLGIFADIL